MLGLSISRLALTVALAAGLSSIAPATSVVSASVRARQAISTSINTGTNNFLSYQVSDYALVPVSDPVMMFANSYRSQTTGLEVNANQALYIAFSFCTNPNGTGRDQTGKTFSFLDWSHAVNDTPILQLNGTMGPALKNNGVAATYADLVAAGGGVQTVSGNPVLTLPVGWRVLVQKTGVTLSGAWMARLIASAPASTSNAIVGTIQGNNATDYNKVAASHAASVINTADWTASGAAPIGSTIPYPVAIYGTTPGVVKNMAVDGDSIATLEPGDAYGDATYYASGMIKRALVKRGIPFVATSVPGTKASQVIGRSLPIRDEIHSSATDLVHDYGHNERGTTWGTGALTPLPTSGNSYVAGDNGFRAIHARYTLERQAVIKPGGKVIASVLLPVQTGGINASAVTVASISSSGTTATATESAAHGLSTNQYALIWSVDVPAYNGPAQITVTSTTTYTFTIPNGGSNLATSTNAKRAVSTAVWPTHTQYANYAPFLLRTGSYSGVPFNTANGDPHAAIDLYTAGSCAFGLYPSLDASQEGTHPLGRTTSGVSNDAYMNTFAINLAAQFAAQGF